ncbi:MAG: phosphoribosylanthranilate isomerase [Paludibacteraceae bacterium]|nr:phosphoribosylanthranilate isomerase [Paludibacteraceae bacterium]
MKKLLKVCGMREAANIKELAALSPDFMGFIFYPPSSRFVSTIDENTIKSIPKKIRKVGVFVNENVLKIKDIAKNFRLDVIQLHGDESPDVCMKLKREGYVVIKAFHIASADDFSDMLDYEGTCDYFLFDTKTQGYGGSGMTFDWTFLDKYTGQTPFLLSGGIRLESVQDLWKLNHPKLAGFDINSGFEVKPALKDIDLVKKFKERMAL